MQAKPGVESTNTLAMKQELPVGCLWFVENGLIDGLAGWRVWGMVSRSVGLLGIECVMCGLVWVSGFVGWWVGGRAGGLVGWCCVGVVLLGVAGCWVLRVGGWWVGRRSGGGVVGLCVGGMGRSFIEFVDWSFGRLEGALFELLGGCAGGVLVDGLAERCFHGLV